MEQWNVKRDGRLLLNELHDIKKKESETIRQFNLRFQKLVDNFPKDIKPKAGAILLYYINALEGNFGFYFRDKKPKDLM